jgi:phytoene synthase
MKFEIQRARDYYAEAALGVPMLANEARVGVAMSLRVYGGILDRLEENGYDNFRKRAYVSKFEKFLYLPDAWQAVSGLPD